MSVDVSTAAGNESGRRFRLTPFDAFMALNAVILIATTLYAYASSELEFGLYAAAMLLLGGLVWRVLRRYDFPVWLLGILQLSVITHFLGGFTKVGPDGTWLYWYWIFGIVRYDMAVHVFNTAVAALALAHIYREAGLDLRPMTGFIIVMTVVGLGAILEMIEFVAVQVIPNTGVGDYTNTLGDLIANTLGACVGYAVWRTWKGTVPRSAVRSATSGDASP